MDERCLKSDRNVTQVIATQDARPLTEGPFEILRLLSQFILHLVETLDRICYAVDCFEAFTHVPVNCHSGD